MKKNIQFSLFLCFVVVGCGQAQKIDQRSFIRSFRDLSTTRVINFQNATNGEQMSEEEAVTMIYNQDTSRLFCTQKSIDMENESDFHISREKYLPKKCFRVTLDSGYLLAYITYRCEDLKQPLYEEVNLVAFDHVYHRRAEMVVHQSTDLDFTTTALLNTSSLKLFVIRTSTDGRHKVATMYRVENFDFVKEIDDVKIELSFEKTGDYLEYLSWEGTFNTKHE